MTCIYKIFVMIFAFLVILLFVCNNADILSYPIGAKESRSSHFAIRRLDCQVFCKKTGFSGYVGGCQCGFTLFANKRSDDEEYPKYYLRKYNKFRYPKSYYPNLNEEDSQDS